MENEEKMKNLEKLFQKACENKEWEKAEELRNKIARLGKSNIPREMNHAKISKILCMIAAIYIAVIPETALSAIFWIVYSVGAIFGINHFTMNGDKETRQMYIIWLILDVYAFIRLIMVYFPG